MENVSGSIELVRVIFLLGAVAALLYKKRFGVTPGGIIVPGTLAVILLTSFSAFIIMMVSALLCWLIYRVTFGHYAIRGRWVAFGNIGIAVAVGLATMALSRYFRVLDQDTSFLSLIIPGLIALSARKYGLQKVMLSTLYVTALTSAVGIMLASLIPYQILSYLTVVMAAYQPLALTNPFIALPISLLCALLVYYKLGLRGGGYLVGPFLAVVMVSAPLQAFLLAASVAGSYYAVRFIQKHTLIIGLERFVLSIFCGYVSVSIIDQLAIIFHFAQYRPSSIILIIAVAVLTNDLTLQKTRDTLVKGIAPSMLISFLTRLAI